MPRRDRPPAGSTKWRSPRSRTRLSTSRPRPWACRSTRCSAARCATGCSSTGRIAAPIAPGEEVRRKGFKGLKTNLIRFDRDKPYMYGPGTGNPPGFPELNVDHHIVGAALAQLEAFRRGAGRDVGLHLDTNFNYKTDGYIKLARALEPLDLVWLEIDLYDPAGLALIRRSARTPISSCESLYGRRQFRPYFEQQSVDYAIIDVAWNGILESVKIAAMADAYEVNVAPHNFNGHLGSLISAHICAVAP